MSTQSALQVVSFRLAVMGGLVALMAANWNGPATDSRHVLLPVSLGIFLGFLSPSILRILREVGQTLIETVKTYAVPVGTGLIISGVGLFVALLPDTLRFVLRDDAYLPPDEQLVIGVAAMMMVGGSFLRRSGRNG